MKRFRVVWTNTASRDLTRVVEFVASESPINAAKVLARLEEAAKGLTAFPGRGRVVPELRWHGIDRYREVQAPPWRIVYRVEEARVVVMAVLDARRGLEDLLLERFLFP